MEPVTGNIDAFRPVMSAVAAWNAFGFLMVPRRMPRCTGPSSASFTDSSTVAPVTEKAL